MPSKNGSSHKSFLLVKFNDFESHHHQNLQEWKLLNMIMYRGSPSKQRMGWTGALRRLTCSLKQHMLRVSKLASQLATPEAETSCLVDAQPPVSGRLGLNMSKWND